MLSASRCRKKLFRNIKYEIILEVTICRHVKKNIGDFAVTKEWSGKTTKTVCFTKEKYPTTNQALARRDGRLFCKKRVMVKAGIPPTISEEIVRRVLWNTDLKCTHFQRKGIMSKNDLKLRLKFARKPVVLEGVELNLLKSAHYY